MWGVCGYICVVDNVIIDEAEEISKGGAPPAVVRPPKMFAFQPRPLEETLHKG